MKKALALLLLCGLFFITAFSAETVKAYTTLEEPLAKELFDAFQTETGIKVDWVRLTTGEAVARIEAEKQNPQASIWVGGVGIDHIIAKNKGLTTVYKSKAAEILIPKEYRDPEGYWTGLYVGILAFATNKDRAKQLNIVPPKSWADLLNPKYKKLIRMANPSTSGTAYNVITNILDINNGDEAKAFDFLKKLDANIDQYTKSGSAPGKSCAIGEIPIAIGYSHDLLKLKAGGAPIEITVPKEGSGFELASMSLIKNGPDMVNAKKLYNWVLSKKSQDIIGKWFIIPLSNLASKNKMEIPGAKLVVQDFSWDAQNKERLVDKWSKEIGSK